MHNVLCYHFTHFVPNEILQIFALLGIHKIRFCNRLEAISEETFAVILIRLLYPMGYRSIIDQFDHSQTWLLIIYNDTIIYLYCRFRKTLKQDKKRLTFDKLSEFSLTIYELGGGHCFWKFIDDTFNAICQLVLK